MKWQEALVSALDDMEGEFDYGARDCCQLVRLYYLELTGEDKGLAFGDYTTAYSAATLVSEYDGVEGILRAVLGDPSGEPQPGYICTASFDDLDGQSYVAAGVYTDAGIWTMLPNEGLGRLSTNRCQEVWPCPVQ